MKSSLPTNQGWFIKKRQQLGYLGGDDGMCFGVAYEGLVAFLADEMPAFTKRYSILAEKDAKEIAEDIKNARAKMQEWSLKARAQAQKYNDQKSLNAAIQKNIADQMNGYFQNKKNDFDYFNALMELDAAAQTIELHFQPVKYPEIFPSNFDLYVFDKLPEKAKLQEFKNSYYITQEPFGLYLIQNDKLEECKLVDEKKVKDLVINKKSKRDIFKEIEMQLGQLKKHHITQNASNTLPLMVSKKIEDQGGIANIETFSGFYSSEELRQYFKTLKTYVENSKPTQPIAFVLASRDHAITIGYDPKTKTWALIDPNQLPQVTIENETDFAKKILSAFLCKKDSIALRSIFYCFKSEADHLKNRFSEWKKTIEWRTMHTIRADKVNAMDERGGTWFYQALRSEQIHVVNTLLETMDVNLVDSSDNTPLSYACKENNIDLIQKLLIKGANPNLAKKDIPIQFAVKSGNLNLAKVLLDYKADPNQPSTNKNMTALHVVASTGNEKIARLLLKNRANPNARLNDGATPLYVAIKYNHPEIVKVLLVYDADPNLSCNGIPPLYLAAANDQIDIVRCLVIEKKINIDQGIEAVSQLLIDHIREPNQKIKFELLLKAKNDGTIPETLPDFTPLHIAIFNNSLETVEALLEHGADFTLKSQNISPIDLALALDYPKINMLLKTKMFDQFTKKLSDIQTTSLKMKAAIDAAKKTFSAAHDEKSQNAVINKLKEDVLNIADNEQKNYQQNNYLWSFFNNSPTYDAIQTVVKETPKL